MASFPRRQGACALVAFVVLAAVQAWPLPRHLSTHLTGPPTGDTGVYVWNTWVFRHELVEGGGSPFTTSSIFSLSAEADLSLHNYTVSADVIAMPLQPLLGVVATFNLVYLVNVALAGFGMFLLVRRVTGRTAESWLAGAVFACAPFIVARSTAHFSLVAAAPLPLFVYWLDRAWETHRPRDAAAAGACVAWAAFSDPYYAVYCAMLGGCLLAARFIVWSPGVRRVHFSRHVHVLLDVAIGALVTIIAAVLIIGSGSIRVGSLSISMRTFYTPMLALTVLALARFSLSYRPVLAWRPPPMATILWPLVISVSVATLLLSPTLYAVGRRMVEGRMSSAPVLWRSSPPGVDLAAYVTPNPNHPLTPAAVTDWIASAPGGFAEQVAALSLVGLGVILVARWRAGFRPRRLWLGIAIGFGVLSLGPFIHVAGLNTYVPTPWALLRYLPIIGAARMPSRFAIVAMLGFCVLLGAALVALGQRFPRFRRTIVVGVGLALAIELLPVPRKLYSAQVPAIYDVIAADPRPVRVLELPYGVRDGLSSLGNFNAVSQFHQTRHHKPIAGGYLSRVSAQRKASYQRLPVRRALIALSEGRQLTPDEAVEAQREGPQFLKVRRIGYVVMDQKRTPADLRDFAIETLGLRKIAEGDGYELYVPLPGPT
jgi:hypothetical protein